MRSEALRNLKTLRQVRSGLDMARSQRCRTTNGLLRAPEEVDYLASLTDPRLQQALEKERRRAASQDRAVGKSRQRMITARERLAMTVNKNRALDDLRRRLQQARWVEGSPPASGSQIPAQEPKKREVELRY